LIQKPINNGADMILWYNFDAQRAITPSWRGSVDIHRPFYYLASEPQQQPPDIDPATHRAVGPNKAAEVSPPCLLATMAAHLPFLPVLLFVFLAVHIPASHGGPAPPLTTYDASICPESSRCGDVSIKYPFFLSNTVRYIADRNYDTPYACGHPDLEISCEGDGPTGTPVIRLGSESYTVLNISNDNKTIVLADSDVLRPGRRCPAVSHNVSFDEVWLLYSTSSNGNLTFFLGYYPALAGLDTYRIDCNGLKSPFGNGGASFVPTPDDHGKASPRA
jgi:hypothetical protein